MYGESHMLFQQIRGATSIITFGGGRFLVDPFLARKGTLPAVPSPWNNSPNPLVELPLPVEDIVAVDAVIVTHMHHFDHFDRAACEALDKALPVFTRNEAEAEDMRTSGFRHVEALTAEGADFRGVTLQKTEALHGKGEAAARNYAQFGLPSEACGVLFSAEGEKRLYIAGDTVWFQGVADVLEKFRPEVVALNAAWAQFYDGTPILMGPEELARVAASAPQAMLIATHMDAVNHARLDRAQLRRFVRERGLEGRFLIHEDGEILNLPFQGKA